MSEETRRVLEMLSQGKVTVDEADQLLRAVGAPRVEATPDQATPRFFRITVNQPAKDGGRAETVNVRVPMQLLRAGVKLAHLIPAQARVHVNDALHEKGFDIDLGQIKPENLEELVDHLDELTVDVDDKDVKVRVFCE